jgi:crotonobetainyl-CoA:carnitine CoA-transferase CaiB-like acyl-CoA transferase
MVIDNKKQTALPSYRVLDLTEGGCMLGGRLLGDLGADVIKIEPPEGSASRIAPYYKKIVSPEKSLFWFAYNANKRGITLNLGTIEGRHLFQKLAAKADVIMESFEPGYLDSLGLGYANICSLKPDIIYTSISFFGQTGPKAHFKGSDLTAWASGGYLYVCGNPDRAPTWISFPQAGFFGGIEGAIGAMNALCYRWVSGEGQHVDVSIQESTIGVLLNVLQQWDVSKVEVHRTGGCPYISTTGVIQPIYFKCKDGYVMVLVQGGNEPFVSSSRKLVEWMTEESLAPTWLQELNWVTDYDATTLKQDLANQVGTAVEKFTLTKTKYDLYIEGSLKRGIFIAPVNKTRDISENLQLEARVYWKKLEHPELNDTLTYCGPFTKLSETPIEYRRRPPLIGEHNSEIYVGELGLSHAELKALKEKGVI